MNESQFPYYYPLKKIDKAAISWTSRKEKVMGHTGLALDESTRPESMNSIANASYCTLCFLVLCSLDFWVHLDIIIQPALVLTSILYLQDLLSPIPIMIQLRVSMSQVYIPSSKNLICPVSQYVGSHLNRCGTLIQPADTILPLWRSDGTSVIC